MVAVILLIAVTGFASLVSAQVYRYGFIAGSATVTKTKYYVNQLSDVDSSADKGTHSNFTAHQQGPDSNFDILAEEVLPYTDSSPMYAVAGSPAEIIGAPDGNYAAITKNAVGEVLDYQGGTGAVKQVYLDVIYYGDVSGSFAWAYQIDGGGWNTIESLPEGGNATSPLTRSYNATGLRASWTWENLNTTDVEFQNNDDAGPEYAYVDSIYVTVVAELTGYMLDLEVQWISVDFDEESEELCIYGGSMGSENLRVDVWDGASWQNAIASLNSGWNNVTVSIYLTSPTFAVRFKGAVETADAVQDSWAIDVTLLHVWT